MGVTVPAADGGDDWLCLLLDGLNILRPHLVQGLEDTVSRRVE